MINLAELIIEIIAVPVLQVEVLLVSALEERSSSVQKIENATDAEDVTRLVIIGAILTILKNFWSYKAQCPTAIVTDIFLFQLFLLNGKAQV